MFDVRNGQGFGNMSDWGIAPSPITDGLSNSFSNSSLGFQGIGNWMQSGGLGGGGGGGFMDSLRSSGFLGSDGNQGWGGMALGALGGLGSAFMGMKNYGLAKQGLADSREQFSKNYAAQRDTLNTQMEDRQRARVAANSGSESVDGYMQRNRIK